MNGAIEFNNTESSSVITDRRPIITCSGELEVFAAIEDNLTAALPQDSCEWRRSLGRPVRSVHISASFNPFSSEALPKGNQWDLIRQPLFHVYWTECTEVETYKTSIREDIESWLKELTSREIQDWLVVVVENYDGKRANKLLPRTTVLDKIRADFAPKQGDRCISVINPGKPEAKSTESWRGLVNRIRHLLLVAYARAVSRLEDHVRQQRERRNEIGWNFMKYFHLQEELAQVLEMLGLYEEALVQYDELDALFTQFVANGITSESVSWLNDFQKPLERWHGLKLGPSLLHNSPSILELRAYLFAKQAHMLLLTNRIWEMASRCLPFLHTTTRELTVLDISAPPGAVACWLFLASLEVLQTCDKFNHADAVEEYSLHTASLWAYASQKLRELGDLCGLIPGCTPTSLQLHTVVQLSAGMGDSPGPPNSPSPTDKLKEALCSQAAFNKTYLELSELAMGTYKHIGRIRSARLVGVELASFYMLLEETQKAAAFLSDAVRTFEEDGWYELAAMTNIQLAGCHKKAGNARKLIKSCVSISSTLEIDTLLRWTYFEELKNNLDSLDKPLVVPLDNNIIKIVSVCLKNDPVIMQNSGVYVELTIDCNFPREIVCTDARISLEKEARKTNEKYCKERALTSKDLKPQDPLLQRIKMFSHLDYKQDKQLDGANIVCKNVEYKRKDSTLPVPLSDFGFSLTVNIMPLVITPGMNTLKLNKELHETGRYYLGQVCLYFGRLQLISRNLLPRLLVEVKEEPPSVKLYKNDEMPLLSGVEQTMNLILTIGSYRIDPNWKVKLTSTMGLTFRVASTSDDDVNKADSQVLMNNSLEIEIGEREIFTSKKIALKIFSELFSTDQQVTIICPWQQKPVIVNLSFTPPLTVNWRLHTVNRRKFVHVTVTGQCENGVQIDEPKLTITGADEVIARNFKTSQVTIIAHGSSYSYVWEMVAAKSSILPALKATFVLNYTLNYGRNSKLYQQFFDIPNYQTQYTLEAHVEPTKGNEFCRVGAVCHLYLSMKCIIKSPEESGDVPKSIMYEVIAEQSVWAVCGRTAGVVSFNSNEEDPQSLVLDVMPLSSGHLPLPLVRISKYITAEPPSTMSSTDKLVNKNEMHPRLEPFGPGQVYNNSKGMQVHVIAAVNEGQIT